MSKSSDQTPHAESVSRIVETVELGARFDEQGWRKIVNALQASNQLGLAALSRPAAPLEPLTREQTNE